MQLFCETDIDRSIAEFKAAVGDLFSDPAEREIALLQSKILQRRLAHKSTRIYQQELCELMTRKLNRELAA